MKPYSREPSLLVLLLLLSVLPYFGLAQEVKRLNGDSLFVVAKDFAFKGSYDTARIYIDTIINVYPQYWDAHTLKARTYAWEGKYDTSLAIINQTLQQNDSLDDLIRFEPTVLYWSGRYADALGIIKNIQATDTVPDDDLMFLKSKTELAIWQLDSALSDIDSLISKDTSRADYKAHREEILKLMLDEHLGVIYGFDYFDNVPNSPRHSVAIEYKKQSQKNIFLGRATYANRFGLNDILLEVDDYWNFGKKPYLFSHLAFSPTSELYPRIRLGLEPYFPLPKGFEVSVGYRFVFFNNISSLAKQKLDSLANPRFSRENLIVHLFTASLGKYFGKNYLIFRAYAGANNIDFINTYELLYRRFFKLPRTYLEAKIGFGYSPDEAYLESIYSQAAVNRSRVLLLGYSQQFNTKWHAKIWGIYDQQMPTGFGPDFNIFSGYIGIWRSF